jgi:hypothetical protein
MCTVLMKDVAGAKWIASGRIGQGLTEYIYFPAFYAFNPARRLGQISVHGCFALLHG